MLGNHSKVSPEENFNEELSTVHDGIPENAEKDSAGSCNSTYGLDQDVCQKCEDVKDNVNGVLNDSVRESKLHKPEMTATNPILLRTLNLHINNQEQDKTVIRQHRSEDFPVHEMDVNEKWKSCKTDQKDGDTCSEMYSISKFMMWPGQNPVRLQSKNEHGYETAIWEIIREDLVTELRYHLKSTPELIHTTDNAGYTPVHVASKYNRVSSLAVLLDWKADPNVVGPYDMYPLHLSARYNSIDAARYILQHGADIMCRDCKQKTPLHHAARKGHQQMIEMLLSCRACNIDVEDEDRLTPLHEACQLKQSKVAKYLIEQGANIDARDISDGTPLIFAAAEGLTDIIEIILQQEEKYGVHAGKESILNHTDNEGMSALHLAVQNNQTHVIDLLLDNGADVNIQNNCSFTPLHMAAINGHTEIVQLLLSRGAYCEARDSDHMTPVHRCAMYGKKDVLDILLKQGASINARTSEQMTPLLVGAWKGHLEVVEYLLYHGAKLLTSDSCMRTALHWAVDQGHYTVLQALIKNGGEELLGMVEHKDETVAHFAARTGNTMIMKLLIDYGVDLDARNQDGKTPLHIAAECGNYASVEIQVDSSKSELNDGDSDGRTPLMLACLSGHYKAARSLLALGADNSIRDENYCTALILAASKGHLKVIELLLDNLAEPNVSDKLKNTALHMSAAGGHVDAVCLLLNRNVLACPKNSYKKTPLDMALDYDQSEVAVAMLRNRKWRDLMASRDELGYSPMKKLVKKSPEAAMVVLDSCVQESDHRKDDMEYSMLPNLKGLKSAVWEWVNLNALSEIIGSEIKLTFDFHYIDPGPSDECCKNKRFFALDTMVEFDREELLSHPLTQSLLIMKWRKFGRYVLYSNLLIYTMYVAALNCYMVLIPAMATDIVDNDRHCPIEVPADQLNNQTYINLLKEQSSLSHLYIRSNELFCLQVILEVFILILMGKELFLLWGQKWRYFVNTFTYWNWIMMISTLLFINPPNRYPCEINWRGGWICSICAWVLLISHLQRVDIVGIYFVMFSEVMLSLMKVMLVLLVFLMAFSQAFAGIIAKVPGFRDGEFYPLTVLAMTLGELNFVENFVEQNNFPFTTDAYIIITIFMITMPIALMNLLIGIAVGDIDKIQKGAYIKRIGLQADQTNNSENRLPRSIQKKIYQRYFVIKPNIEKNTRWARFKYHVFGIQTTLDFITPSETDLQLKTMQQLQRNIHRNKLQLSDVQSHMKVQNELLKNICEYFNIDVKNKMDNISIYSDRTDLHSIYM